MGAVCINGPCRKEIVDLTKEAPVAHAPPDRLISGCREHTPRRLFGQQGVAYVRQPLKRPTPNNIGLKMALGPQVPSFPFVRPASRPFNLGKVIEERDGMGIVTGAAAMLVIDAFGGEGEQPAPMQIRQLVRRPASLSEKVVKADAVH